MRVSHALLLTAASSVTAVQDQKVLGAQHNQQGEKPSASLESDSLWSTLEGFWGEASEEIRALWDEVSTIAPGTLQDAVIQAEAVTGSRPAKDGTRRPDGDWDFHVSGTEAGQAVGGDSDFSNYALRARHVDPSKLGVDTVKQYSGYLDAIEADKHLFFCM